MLPLKYFECRVLFWFALLLGVGLRLPYINVPLASDELATVSIWAQMPLVKIPANYQYPNNHIFLTLILAVILKIFGVNHFMLRLPVLVAGIISLVLVYISAKKITGNEAVSLGALIILALNVHHIYYSTNARGYVLIMMLTQACVLLILSIFRNEEGKIFMEPDAKASPGILLGLWALMVLGTWTLPTFILFEFSILVFFGWGLVLNFRRKIFDFKFSYLQIVVIVLAAMAGAYVQYFVFIDKEMMGQALSHAAKTGMYDLAPQILEQWIHPWEPLSLVFLLLWMVGLGFCYKKNRDLFFFFICVFLVPVFAVMAGSMTGFMKQVPAARVFLYLQPFFFICVSWGAYLTLKKTLDILSRRFIGNVETCRPVKILFILLFLPLVWMMIVKLNNKYFPEREAREPFHKVLNLVQRLGSNDLILTTNESHVWFYLYGAEEMRRRVYNILSTGKLGSIYLLDHLHSNAWSIEKMKEVGREWLRIKNFTYINFKEPKQEDLFLPAGSMDLMDHFDTFRIYKINPAIVHKVYDSRDDPELNRWWVPEPYQPFIKKSNEFPPGQGIWVFQGSFYMFEKKNERREHSEWSLDINLVQKNTPENLSVMYLNGTVNNGQLEFRKTWLGNDWVMDHPYGEKIFNRPWTPKIFLTESNGSTQILKGYLSKSGMKGSIKNMASYRLSFPPGELKVKDTRSLNLPDQP